MKRFLVLTVALFSALNSFGWGQKGHDTVAYIAECNLTPEVYKKVVAILDNHSLVYYANWMDNASHNDYRYTKSWHYANIDKGYTYETMQKNEHGDVLTAINEIIAKLKSGTLTAEQETLNMRFLIHLVGDIHAPLHVGHLSDLGGNTIKVKFFYREKKLHSIWDTDLVEFAHKWSYTEWRQQLDCYCTADERARLSQGEPIDWLNESFDIATDIYINTPAKTEISFNYVAYYTPIIEKRLLAAGLRLARVLNEIYGCAE